MAARVAERQARLAVDLGQADDGIMRIRAGGKLQRLGRARGHAQRHAAVLLGAEVAVIGAEVKLGTAHPQEAVLDLGRLDDVARARLVAFLAADAGADQVRLVLASRRAVQRHVPGIAQGAQSQQRGRTAHADEQRAARDAHRLLRLLRSGLRRRRIGSRADVLRGGRLRALLLLFAHEDPSPCLSDSSSYARSPGRGCSKTRIRGGFRCRKRGIQVSPLQHAFSACEQVFSHLLARKAGRPEPALRPSPLRTGRRCASLPSTGARAR